MSNNITTIEPYTFAENVITSIDIPSSVQKIGNMAFFINKITSANISEGVSEIGVDSFANNFLTTVTIPSTVKTVRMFAFAENLISDITFPSTVTLIEHGVLVGNQLPDSKAFTYKRNADGTDDNTILLSYGGAKRTGVVIPSTVISIEKQALSYNQLTSVIIPSSVKTLAPYVFYSNQLTNITLPANLTLTTDSVSPTFYTAYVTNNAKAGGTYTAPSQEGVWTKQP